MSDEDLVECLICGGRYRSLGHHVRAAHEITANEYRDRHGIRRRQPLTAPSTNARFREAIGRQIEDGCLAAHYATNAARGPAARAASARALRELRANGAVFAPSRKPVARIVIEAAVTAIESGQPRKATLATLPFSECAFYDNLARHPDLKARLAAHFRRRCCT